MGTRGHREEGSPDTRNPRRGFIGHFTNLHGATERALGRAGSLQRVHRAVIKFARRHSEGAVARAILAEGSSGALQIRTAPQWERFEARDPCRGFIGHSTNTRNVENDRGLTKSRMNTPHTANIDAGSHADSARAWLFCLLSCPFVEDMPTQTVSTCMSISLTDFTCMSISLSWTD